MAREAHEAPGRPGARRHRDHQPARDRGGLGPAHRRAAAPRDRLAGPAHRRALRRASRGRARAALPRAHRAGARPVLLRAPRSSGCCREGGVGRRARCSAPIDSWLAYKLTGRHVTDYSNASRTLLFDIRALDWDPELCEMLGVDPASLPEPRAERARVRRDERARRLGAGGRDRRRPAGGARTGRPATSPGSARTPTAPAASCSRTRAREAPPPADGLLTTVAWGVEGRVDYALEAAIFVTGAAVQWLRDALGVIRTRPRPRAWRARSTATTACISCPPSPVSARRTGTRTRAARSSGLTRGTGTAHLARAALEAIGLPDGGRRAGDGGGGRRAARGAEGRRRGGARTPG